MLIYFYIVFNPPVNQVAIIEYSKCRKPLSIKNNLEGKLKYELNKTMITISSQRFTQQETC